MIEVIDLIGKKILINNDLIKKIESVPDTIISFVDGSVLAVRDTPTEIQCKIISFKIKTQNLSFKE